MAKPTKPQPKSSPKPAHVVVGDTVARIDSSSASNGELGDVVEVDETHVTVQWRAKGGRRVQLDRKAQNKRWRLVPKVEAPAPPLVDVTPEQRQALAEGYDSEDAAYFTAVYTLDAFERRFGRLPDKLRAGWAKLRAAADEMQALLVEHGATMDTWAEAEGIDTPDSIAAAEEAAAENDGAE